MNKMNRTTISLALLALVTLLALAPAVAFAQVGNIDPAEKNAWAENAGWLDFRPLFGGVTVGGTYLSGYAWSENVGWVKLGSNAGGPYGNTTSTNWGVNHSLVMGDLTGFGWSENAGWINFGMTFSTVNLNNGTLKMTGYAWSENAGWIHFRNAGAFPYGVATTTAPVALQVFTVERESDVDVGQVSGGRHGRHPPFRGWRKVPRWKAPEAFGPEPAGRREDGFGLAVRVRPKTRLVPSAPARGRA